MINGRGEIGEIVALQPRQIPATQPIGVASLSLRPVRTEVTTTEAYGTLVQIFPDGSTVTTYAGEANVSVRSGQAGTTLPLGRTQVIVRVDPPEPSNAKGTELMR